MGGSAPIVELTISTLLYLFISIGQARESYIGDSGVNESNRSHWPHRSDCRTAVTCCDDSPPTSYLFDLERDPNAEHDILTDAEKKKYDERIIGELQQIADYYGYKPGVGSLLVAQDPAGRK